jgi:hypothetical protein
MKPYRLAPALILIAITTSCDFAARTGIVRDDMRVLTDAQNAIANTKINRPRRYDLCGRPAYRSVGQHQQGCACRDPARPPQWRDDAAVSR